MEDTSRVTCGCRPGAGRVQQVETVHLPFYLLHAAGHKMKQRHECGKGLDGGGDGKGGQEAIGMRFVHV